MTKKQKNILYYLAIALVTIKVILNTSELIEIPEQIDNIFTIFLSGMFIIKLFSQTYTKKQIIYISIIGILLLYVSFVSNEFVIMLSYLAIISMKSIEVKDIIKIMLPIKITLVLFHIIVYIISGAYKVPEYYNFVRASKTYAIFRTSKYSSGNINVDEFRIYLFKI